MRLATGESIAAEEAEIVRANGSRGFISMTSSPVRGASGAIVAGLVTYYDITATKGLEGEEAAKYGRRLSGASMGLIGAAGALGGVGINMAFRQSFLSYGSGTGAFVAFLAYYAACFGVTWAVYLRRPAAQGQASAATEAKPQLNYAEV